MKKILLTISFVMLSQSAFAATKAPVDAAAIVNGVAIPNALIENSVTLSVQQGKKDTPELRQLIKEEFIKAEVVAQQAVKLGLDKTPEGQAAFTELKRSLLVDLYLANYDKNNPISDAALRAEYDRQVALIGDKAYEYRLSNIVTKTEADSRAALARIKKGEDFAKVAKEVSIDATARDGGALGWLLQSAIVPSVAKLVVGLADGSMIANPIETPGGWQLVRLEEKRPFKTPKFEDVTQPLRAGLLQKQRLEAIKKLREAAKVTGNN